MSKKISKPVPNPASNQLSSHASNSSPNEISNGKLKAVLVGIHLPKVTDIDFDSSLKELTRLVTTLGYEVIGQVTQKRSSDKSPTVLGDGKLQELASWTGGTGRVASVVEHKLSKAAEKWKVQEEIEKPDPQAILADLVIVDTDLSPSQIRNLESATGKSVLDRTGVIIEIFSRHARTKSARLQVEIARLTYVAPRLRETGGNEDRQGGGIGGKGAGESSLELDKRKIRDRIKELKIELSSIANEHQTRRARREREGNVVALVGYTNAGKSSLMRAMTGSEVLVADKLFATLDTTIRPIYPETKPKILLSDTVGFIKKLPHDLVASFKSTLDEALNASLLLFVVDSSDPSFRSQLKVTQDVLGEVGADSISSLLILNKKDLLTESERMLLADEFPEALMISSKDKIDLDLIREKILSYFEEEMIDENFYVPYTATGVIGSIRKTLRVLNESYDENGTTITVRGNLEKIEKIRKLIQPKKSQR